MDVCVARWFDEEVFQRAEWREFRHEVSREMQAELHSYVYGKKHPSRHIIRYPANWLEAVKERFAPCWLRDRWPVKFTVTTATLEETYPDLKISLPAYTPVLKFHTMDTSEFPCW